MPDDRCACGAPAVMYLASGVRCCLAHVPRDAPSIRSDVPVSRDPVRPCADCGAPGQWGPFTCCDECWAKAYPGTAAAAARHAGPEHAWRQRVRELLHREIDMRQRMAEAVRRANAAADILRRHGDIGARAALRALEGEP